MLVLVVDVPRKLVDAFFFSVLLVQELVVLAACFAKRAPVSAKSAHSKSNKIKAKQINAEQSKANQVTSNHNLIK